MTAGDQSTSIRVPVRMAAALSAIVAVATAFGLTQLGAGASARGPERGETVVLKLDAGEVQFMPPGTDAFVRLTGREVVPVRTLIDTRDGAVLVTTARGRTGRVDTGRFWGGFFEVRQPDVPEAPTTAVLRMKVGPHCDANRTRILWARAHDPFETSGNHSSAAAVGTEWKTKDTCDGTLTSVRSGNGVVVRDFHTHDRVRLQAGERYRAKALPDP